MEDRLPVIKKPNPKSRSNKKLLVFLFIFFITLLLILFFQSSLSKITEIEIQGQQLISKEEIAQAAAVKAGDHFFSVSSSKVETLVKALKMVESVEVSKKFPGRLIIQVHEYPKVAYQVGENGQIEALLADASVVPVNVQGVALDKPILTGWSKDDPLKVKLCLAMSKLPAAYFSDVSEIKPSPTLPYPDKIKMYTRSHYEVQTTIEYLPEKMKYLDSYIASLQSSKISGGVITMLEADTHAPFDKDSGKTNAKDTKDSAEGKDSKDSKDSKEGKDGKTPASKETDKRDTASSSADEKKPEGQETGRN
ncbi:cell division protein FtsQ/DivIB [Paenibacillus tyrfis]|uniref:cell division protein FtsQ/DivIB n=1 Tax=Paenibacillus tyrfis TaxID=1501230 RepID=UPI00209D33F5|nr:FtsQ-type POTRA domain-containing protein [Paenibacillus tyrfis]MCP1309171.1 FtsQ-type POTRA domain-containing protein [Paenibacillus tyrfis]